MVTATSGTGETDRRRSVRYQKQLGVAGETRTPVSVEEAVRKVKEMAAVRVDRTYKNARPRKGKVQTVELTVHLGIDPRQADQIIRGAMSLPHGIGKTRRVVAFCEGADAEAAKEAGAVEAGGDELIQKIEKGWMDFDVAVAHPSMMGRVGRLGRVLGPQGKMPSPKAGTVTQDVATAVRDFAGGRIEFRNDAGGNVHLPVGRSDFADEKLTENIEAALQHLQRMRPTSAKGQFVKGVSLSGAQTPGVQIVTGAQAG